MGPPLAERGSPRTAPSSPTLCTSPDPTEHNRAGRTSYITVGTIQRNLIRAAGQLALTTIQLRVLLAVLDRTVTYSKLADYCGSRELSRIVYGVTDDEVNGYQRRKVTRALQALRGHGLVFYENLSLGRHARMLVAIADVEGVLQETPLPEGVHLSAVNGVSGETRTDAKGDPERAQRCPPVASTPSNHPEESVDNNSLVAANRVSRSRKRDIARNLDRLDDYFDQVMSRTQS